jgi:hypothetical protein
VASAESGLQMIEWCFELAINVSAACVWFWVWVAVTILRLWSAVTTLPEAASAVVGHLCPRCCQRLLGAVVQLPEGTQDQAVDAAEGPAEGPAAPLLVGFRCGCCPSCRDSSPALPHPEHPAPPPPSCARLVHRSEQRPTPRPPAPAAGATVQGCRD